jgi:hypothetical protein
MGVQCPRDRVGGVARGYRGEAGPYETAVAELRWLRLLSLAEGLSTRRAESGRERPAGAGRGRVNTTGRKREGEAGGGWARESERRGACRGAGASCGTSGRMGGGISFEGGRGFALAG